ncbi:putative aarF domain-containing kinase chloroplastic [Micractinium conductrix]|uniref:AarF domain-containing kinase chloroplastic n=1 Tax=Micractinium conductrix TaxID=554055 RepID=A0A2P6V9J2_9CHLO|nr:putative aarF domain-containing kinase chloroplastic [Micractinium conductrix]|eukprot:PSC70755.1 putative aarF domain-containing kinase chloroplastic [Micractinium conductrix]
MTRGVQIAAALGSWFMEGRVTNRGATAQGLTDIRADKLRTLLTDLGPAFVKIGQAVSSRPDVAPPEFLRELEKLQDQIPPFCNDQAFEVIQAEYGVASVSEIFSAISPEAVAAASLGQVYRGVLRSTGEAVAVKVQRPGVAASIAVDVYVLRQLLAVVRRWRKFNSDLPALLDEWASSLFRELDYRHEAANGVRFRELYGHMEDVYVPRMHTQLCTRKVLVMEWVDGERLRTAYSAASEASGSGGTSSKRSGSGGTGERSDDLRLVEVGVRCSLEQMLEEGFYHADPHPGNLLRTRDGKLAYLDFGMMGEVDVTIRRGLMRATLHLVNREFEALADDFVTLGMLPKAEGDEKASIVPALTGVFEEALRGGVSNLSFGELSGNLGRTMYSFKFQIPAYYTLLVRSLSVLEGIALASDTDYKVLGAAYPWIARRLLTDTTPELRSTLVSLLYKDGQFNFRRMESLISQAVRPTGRPQPRRSADGTRSAVQRGDALALLLAPEGEFVRGIVTEELAKGIDAAWRLAADTAVGAAHQQILAASLDARGSTLGSASGGSVFVHALAEALAALPRLSDERDREQVEGISRLARVLQESTAGQRQQQRHQGPDWFQEQATGSGAETPWEAAYTSLQTAAAILQWVVDEAETLTAEERTEALRLPISIGQAVASRAAARTLRWLLVGDVFGTAASQADAAAAADRAARAARNDAANGSQAGFAAAAAASAASAPPNPPPSGGGGGGTSSSSAGTAPPSGRQASAGGGAGNSGRPSTGNSSNGGNQQQAVMRPLSPTSNRPTSSSTSSSGNGSGGTSYRSNASGSSVIVRPTGTAAGRGAGAAAAGRR